MKISVKRAFVAAGIAAAMIAVTSACGSESADQKGGQALTIVDAGGSTHTAIKEAYVKPFVARTGTKVKSEEGGDLGKLRAMVESGNVTTDLLELGSTRVEQAKAEGLIEDLDWDAINPENIDAIAKKPYSFGYQYFATYMLWAKDAAPITTWAEFWDTKRQPGKRALSAGAAYTLPIAAIASGVDPEQLYPLDLDRAFKSLEKIKKDLVLWDVAGQTEEMLRGKNVVYASSYDTGLLNNKEGIGYDFSHAVLNVSNFVVPKGAKNKAAAMDFLHEVSIAKNQADALKYAPYTGTNPDYAKLVDANVLKNIPTAVQFQSTQIKNDDKWWAEHGEEVEKRWAKFKLSL